MPTPKTSLRLAASAMSLYSLHLLLICIAPYQQWKHSILLQGQYANDIYSTFWNWLLLTTMAFVCAIFYRHRTAIPYSKHNKILTYAISVLLLISLAISIVSMPMYAGCYYCYLPAYLRLIIALAVPAWLWQLSFVQQTISLSKSFSVSLIICAILSMLPIALKIASALMLCINGHRLFLHTYCLISWLRIIIPAVLFCWYSLHLIKNHR